MAAPAALIAIPVALGILSALGHLFPPLGNFSNQQQFSFWPNQVPDIFSLIDLAVRGTIKFPDYQAAMRKQGYDDEWALRFYESGRQFLSVADYLVLWRRGHLNDEQLHDAARQIKVAAPQLEMFKRATEFFPNPQDLVQFAVREVYSEQVRKRFGLDQDLPPRFLTEAWKAGLPREQATNFWASHWRLPGSNQGFEMLHRRIIDEPTLKLLLKALDIMPFWRDRLIQLSYNPLTRVDVRRMYRTQVLDEQEVFNAYLDLGYSPENAQRMLDFTLRYENQETVGVSRSNVIAAYRDNLITRDNLREYLQGFGYPDKVVAFWEQQAVYQKAEDEVKLVTSDLMERYRAGELDISDIRNALLDEDLPAHYVDAIISRTVKLKAGKVKIPSKEDLETWLVNQVIDDQEYVRNMRLLGYRDTDIVHYLTQLSLEQDTTQVKYLPLKTYTRWLTTGILKVEQYTALLSAQGISPDDIARLLLESGVNEDGS